MSDIGGGQPNKDDQVTSGVSTGENAVETVDATKCADFLVVANRLPTDLVTNKDGSQEWKRSPGGLVTALEPILKKNHGAWIGWPGVPDVSPEPFEQDGKTVVPLALSADEVQNYYEGFSNDTLWPLYHNCIVPPTYREDWWRSYQKVNRRFAERAAEVAAPNGIVWVNDYQLQLVPQMLRELRPDVRIGFFLHIPFPPLELFDQLPWRDEIIDGLLGADLVGFHLPHDAVNFQRLTFVRRKHAITRGQINTPGHYGEVAVPIGDNEFRSVRVGAFPISIDSPRFNATARQQSVRRRSRELRQTLGNPEKMALGVDRSDYTKGIEIRLEALHQLLQEGRIDPEKFVFVQLATPSRERVDAYRELRSRVEEKVARINGEFGSVGRPVISYLHQSAGFEELLALYRSADVMLVTPLKDGMNLVCKEYVAATTNGNGALVLSEFTGAARELRAAYLCNPYDIEGVKDAIMSALTDSDEERRRRMRALRRQVLTHDVNRWAHSFLNALPENSTPKVNTQLKD